MSDKPDDPLAPRDVTILRPRPGAGRRPAPAPGQAAAPAAPAPIAPAAAPQNWTPSQAAPGIAAPPLNAAHSAIDVVPVAAPMGLRQQQVQHTAASLSEFTSTGVNP